MSTNENYKNKKKEMEELLDSCVVGGVNLKYDIRDVIKTGNKKIDQMVENEKGAFGFLDTFCQEIKDDMKDTQEIVHEDDVNEDMLVDEITEKCTVDDFRPVFKSQKKTAQMDVDSTGNVGGDKVSKLKSLKKKTSPIVVDSTGNRGGDKVNIEEMIYTDNVKNDSTMTVDNEAIRFKKATKNTNKRITEV
jgi:hypothetical protein